MNVLEKIKARCEVLIRIREFFFQRGFLEVQTPVLYADTMVDAAIDPIPVYRFDSKSPLKLEDRLGFLQTSPEFAMKELLLDGCEAIFEISPVFRGGESGDRHRTEFTMLEWYRVGDSYEAGIQLLSDLSAQFFPMPPERVTYASLFKDAFDINPHVAQPDKLKAIAVALSLDIPDSLGLQRSEPWLQLLMSEIIEPELGQQRPVVVCDWPEEQCALAKLRPTQVDGQQTLVAERFELYVSGLELANGYHELTDGHEQQCRLELNNRRREENGLPPLETSNRLTERMKIAPLPDCCGVALGVERLLMAIHGESNLDAVS